jgi:hypothetical protein
MFVTILAALCLVAGAEEKGRPAAGTPANPVGGQVLAGKAKPLSGHIEKALAYLVNQQHADGGWGQGGGWRSGNHGGRVEGSNVEDPADVASTCMAALALLRAGSTPREGPYAKNVAQAVNFICAHVDRADKDSLFVTDVRDTQVQVKIGPYVDTFLAALVLAELKGKMPTATEENRLVAALDKTVAKIEKNQKEDGTFAGNNGWASVFSQGLASKSLNRARQNGVTVKDDVLARAEKNAMAGMRAGYSASVEAPSLGSALAGRGVRSAGAYASSGPSDAGVAIYSSSNMLAALQEAVNTEQDAKVRARRLLRDKNAPVAAQEKARLDLGRIAKVEEAQKAAAAGVVERLGDKRFIQGFGSNGGEEFLSYLNISESLVVQGGAEWKKWDESVTENLNRIQNQDGSWSGNHCITGRTICTSAALLVLLADRTPIPVAAKGEPRK